MLGYGTGVTVLIGRDLGPKRIAKCPSQRPSYLGICSLDVGPRLSIRASDALTGCGFWLL